MGTHTSTRGLGLSTRLPCTFSMKYCSIFSVKVKSAMTPSFMGRTAVMWPGVRPSMFLASVPTATILPPPPGSSGSRPRTAR